MLIPAAQIAIVSLHDLYAIDPHRQPSKPFVCARIATKGCIHL
jgi:hypothetical protein